MRKDIVGATGMRHVSSSGSGHHPHYLFQIEGAQVVQLTSLVTANQNTSSLDLPEKYYRGTAI